MDAHLPTGYENYPRPEETERDAIAGGWQNPPAPTPIVHHYQAREPYPPNPPQGSRRSLLLGIVGVGVVGVIGLSAWRPSGPDLTEEPPADDPGYSDDPFDPGSDGEVVTDVLAFGGLDFDVPDGWTVMADTDTRALITHGHNQMLMVRYEGSSPDPADELDSAIAQSGTDFHGSLSKAKVGSDHLRAVRTGTGTFEGRPARQSAEVLVASEDLSTLFIQQVLSASEKSDIAADAARLAADLRDSWPW